MKTFAGRTVLVTGAGGSIGSQLCRLAIGDGAQKLILVSLTEAGLFNVRNALEREFGPDRKTELVGVLGNAGDEVMMERLLQDVDTVIHAAAHKHVPICESNPCAAIANNVGVTFDLAQLAARARVDQFCLISSDKAVKPASVMGRTKRLAEQIVRAQHDGGTTDFITVRFGNVMDSAGSVLPLWREQIAAGGPITLTDARCERYFMTLHSAVGLISLALSLDTRGGTFVFDMGPPVNLKTLALRTIAKHAETPIEIREIGLRPGEKLTEELHYGGELVATEYSGIMRIVEPAPRLDFGKLQLLLQLARNHSAVEARELLAEMTA